MHTKVYHEMGQLCQNVDSSFSQIQFNLFLLLFMGLIVFFDTIHGSQCTIYSTFSKKVFSFSKISESQIDP